MLDFSLRKLDTAQEATLRRAFDDALADYEQSLELRDMLRAQFERATILDERDYTSTFFQWHVRLTWEHFSYLPREEFPQVIARQLHLAILLGFDPWKKIMDFLTTQILGENDRVIAYTEMRQAVFNSPAIVGSFQGSEVTLKKLVEEVTAVNNSGNGSLEMAELSSQIVSVLYESNTKLLGDAVQVSSQETVQTFLDLIHFLIGIKPKDITVLIDEYQYQYYSPRPASNEKEAVGDDASSPAVNQLESESEGKIPSDQPVSPATSYTAIKDLIDEQFPQDDTGQYVNVEEVLHALEALAEQQGDPQIQELYYFDAGLGEFTWNKDLLKE